MVDSTSDSRDEAVAKAATAAKETLNIINWIQNLIFKLIIRGFGVLGFWGFGVLGVGGVASGAPRLR